MAASALAFWPVVKAAGPQPRQGGGVEDRVPVLGSEDQMCMQDETQCLPMRASL